MSMYTVPAGYRAFMQTLQLVGDFTKNTTFYLYERPGANLWTPPYGPIRLVSKFPAVAGVVNWPWRSPPVFEPETDIWFTAQVAAGTSPVALKYDLKLEAI